MKLELILPTVTHEGVHLERILVLEVVVFLDHDHRKYPGIDEILHAVGYGIDGEIGQQTLLGGNGFHADTIEGHR